MASCLRRRSTGALRFILHGLFIPAIPVMLFFLLSGTISVAGESHRHEYRPRPAHIPRIEGTWFFKAYVHPGRFELYWTRDGWEGRIFFDSFGRWEDLTDVFFDFHTGEIRFRQVNSNQQYSGILSGDRIEGTFFTPGLGTYPWNAWREAGSYGREAKPARFSRIEGTWLLRAYVHPGRLEFYWTRNGWEGKIRFDSSGRWEELADVFFDFRTGEVQFRRINGDQQFSGTLSGDHIDGTFFTPGLGTYPWNASR